MKRTHLIAVLIGLVVMGIFTADAAAMYHPTLGRFMQRDSGAGGAMRIGAGGAMRIGAGGAAPVGRFIPRDPTGTNQYADGMNLYQYVRSNPVVLVDPQGLWSWHNTNDVYIIQTILNNNAKRFGLDLSNYGAGGNGIDGKYGSKTRAAVCKFQRELVKAGCGLPTFGADGRWGQETTTAFEQCEKANKVNWRYAHLRIGIFVGGDAKVGTPWGGLGLSGMVGAHATFDRLYHVDWHFGAIGSYTNPYGAAADASVKAAIVLAANVFNSEDWGQLGTTKGDWGVSTGPLKKKYAKLLSGTGKTVWNIAWGLLKNKDNIGAGIEVIQATFGGDIWRGKPQAVTIAVPIGVGAGGWKGTTSSGFTSTSFEIGN